MKEWFLVTSQLKQIDRYERLGDENFFSDVYDWLKYEITLLWINDDGDENEFQNKFQIWWQWFSSTSQLACIINIRIYLLLYNHVNLFYDP